MILLADSEGPDQTVAPVCRLTWSFIVRIRPEKNGTKEQATSRKLCRCHVFLCLFINLEN